MMYFVSDVWNNAIESSHAARKNEFRRNPRSHSRSLVLLLFVLLKYTARVAGGGEGWGGGGRRNGGLVLMVHDFSSKISTVGIFL